jgi:hypothetical protein
MHKYMATKNMLIIKDARGEIIGAQVENPTENEITTFISPEKPEHTLHRVADVPGEILDLADPAEFHRAITAHVKSGHAKVTRTSAEQLNSIYSHVLASRNMLIIRDAHGEIIGAQVENPTENEITTFISPDKPEHTLHRVADVPGEIFDLADPTEFHRAITAHVKSGHAKVTRTSAEELNSTYSHGLASRGREAAQ